mgnify:FL=1
MQSLIPHLPHEPSPSTSLALERIYSSVLLLRASFAPLPRRSPSQAVVASVVALQGSVGVSVDECGLCPVEAVSSESTSGLSDSLDPSLPDSLASSLTYASE